MTSEPSTLPRSERRRLLRQARKRAKRAGRKPAPPASPEGNRAAWRAKMRHTHSQTKPIPRKDIARKKKYRKWRRKHRLPVFDYHYPIEV